MPGQSEPPGPPGISLRRPQRPMTRILTCALFLVVFAGLGRPPAAAETPAEHAEHHAGRKVVKRVLPVYPELARSLEIRGAVKLLVTVAPNGSVKSARPLGGNPAFVEAAMGVIDKWKFVSASEQTTEMVEIKFVPTQ